MYNWVAHFQDFGGENVSKIRDLKIGRIFTSTFYTFSKLKGFYALGRCINRK